MVEGELSYRYDSVTGEAVRCYIDVRLRKELEELDKDYPVKIEKNPKLLEKLVEKTSFPVSGMNCYECSPEKCLDCNNYVPSTKTYSEKEQD